MKQYLEWMALLLTTIVLSGCLYQNSRKPTADLTYETWQRQVDTSPREWARGASRWFTEGEATTITELNNYAAPTAAMTTSMVKVPDTFTHIKVNGRFQVQLFGTKDSNSVFIYGPNALVREVKVKVTRDTLFLEEMPDAPRRMDNVIIRVGIRNLASLTQQGPGRIEGRYIRSGHLCITSSGSGNIYLGGAYNVTNVTATGCGAVNLFGAITPMLDIRTNGRASVNVSGNVGIHSITHHGMGNVNVVGANSDCLIIKADGAGKIGVNGWVALKEVDAHDRVCVFVYYVNGDTLNVYLTDHAHVGLAGCVRAMNVDAGKGSRFDGHYMFTSDAYVRAHDAAHINVTGTNKVFAAATGNSSVYLFSSPNVLTQFYRDSGVVLPIMENQKRYGCGYCPYFKGNTVYKD